MKYRVSLFVRAASALALLFVMEGLGPAGAADTGKVRVVIFKGGEPVSGLTVSVESGSMRSDADGVVRYEAEAGRHTLTLLKDDLELARIQVPVVAGETTEVIITLAGAGRGPRVMIESAAENLTDLPDSTTLDSRQLAVLSGTVTEIGRGTPVANARVLVQGRDEETRTDSRGKFSVELPPGTYSLSLIHPEYAAQGLVGVEVSEDRGANLKIEMTPASFELEEYTVTAVRIEGGIASLTEERKSSANIIDVIGAEQISKSGDSNAAAALRRVTGLTMVGGKYVYVRGMGERYSSSLLNYSSLPSTEPERRVVPLDLIPSMVIESVSIQKSYSPDMPGEFGGGVILIQTKGFPNKLTSTASISLGYSPGTTGEEGLTYEGGKLDWLGFEDGARAMPDNVREAADKGTLSPISMFSSKGFTPQELEMLGESMSDIWVPVNKPVPMDFGMSAQVGNKWDLGGGALGFLLGVTYKNSYDLEEKEIANFVIGTGNKLEPRVQYDVTALKHNIDLGAILEIGGNIGANHEINSTTVMLRNTEDMARSYKGYSFDLGQFTRVTTLRWIEQMLLSEQMRGHHEFPELLDTSLDWSYTFSYATRGEPDRREVLYELEQDSHRWFVSPRTESNSRVFSDLKDNNHDINLKVTVPFPVWNDLEASVSAGANIVLRDREVETRRFQFRNLGVDPALFYQDAEDLFVPANIGPDGFQLQEFTRPEDNYNADITINAYYVMATVPITANLSVSGGVRMEYCRQRVETFALFDKSADPVVSELINNDTLPAVTVTYKFFQDMQVRASYSKTLSRPDFRELSPATYTDVVGGREVFGNPDLNRAVITNYDLRWEWYPSMEDYLSLALFYKEFVDPIESKIISGSGPSLTYQNAKGATNLGAEMEFRTNLGNLTHYLAGLYLAGNFAYIQSQVELDRKSGVETSKERPLEGQSPYVINFTLGYENLDSKTNVALLYNVFGERIAEVGSNKLPDVYEQPFHELNLVASQGFGKFTLGFKASNLLNQEIRMLQEDEIYEAYQPGQTFSISLSWKL